MTGRLQMIGADRLDAASRCPRKKLSRSVVVPLAVGARDTRARSNAPDASVPSVLLTVPTGVGVPGTLAAGSLLTARTGVPIAISPRDTSGRALVTGWRALLTWVTIDPRVPPRPPSWLSTGLAVMAEA